MRLAPIALAFRKLAKLPPVAEFTICRDFSFAVLAGQRNSALPSGIVNPQRLAGNRPEPAVKQLLGIAGFYAIFNVANY